jgi:hypothetical protein
MRAREKDDIDFDKFIDLIEITHHHGTTLIIDQRVVVDHREFEKSTLKAGCAHLSS